MKQTIKCKYPINDCFLQACALDAKLQGGLSASLGNFLCGFRFCFARIPSNIKQKKYKLGKDKRSTFNMYIYRPKNANGVLPCLFYLHGGAFLARVSPRHKKLAAAYAQEHGCAVVLPDYRSACKNPFPAPLTDALEAFDYIYSNASVLNIDRGNIVLFAKSSGACLAAGLTHILRDRGNTPIKGQMLIYPVLDKSCSTASMNKFADTPEWDSTANKKMWDIYTRGEKSKYDKYLSPFEAEEFGGLPQTYIETAEFDCLHDEAVQYAYKLEQSGVNVILRETYGTVHAYDSVDSFITNQSIQTRNGILKKYFTS